MIQQNGSGNPYSLDNAQPNLPGGPQGVANHAATPNMFASSNGLGFESGDHSPGYIPTQFKTHVTPGDGASFQLRNTSSFRHQNRQLVSANQSNVGPAAGTTTAGAQGGNAMARQNIHNATIAYKKVSNQRPSVYRNVNRGIYESATGAATTEEEGETANFGAMMEFHHSPQQDFFKRNPLGNQPMPLDNSNGMQIGRLRMPRESFHQSGAMSDSGGAAPGRQYRSNSHANLDQGAFMSPVTANSHLQTGFESGALGGPLK